MEVESGKLFIGGISWDTNEDRLREYFQSFGEVVESVIMKDRTTGRARGFGFIVFADPAIAERVVKEKHIIDGRTVEAKKAVPRDAQNILNRNNSSTHSSPGPTRTKKIFVGGLASTVTVSDFKEYFDQFGTITDVVVMYDQNTQRPRGFGFITYDSEEAVDRVLVKTFHELNAKMVEVKRAVPKELSPGPTRSPLGGYTLNRVSSFLNTHAQGYNPNSMGDYGVRMDGRFSPLTVVRSGYPPFSPSNYGIGPTLDSELSSNNGGGGNFGSNISFGRDLNLFYGGNSNRYSSPIGYGIAGAGTSSTMRSSGRSVWGHGIVSYNTHPANSNDIIGSGSGSIGSFSAFKNAGEIWGSSPVSGQAGENRSFSSGNISYRGGENSFTTRLGYGRNRGSSTDAITSYTASNDFHDLAFEDLYGGGSVYGEASGSFDHSLGNSASDVTPNNSVGYFGGYNFTSSANSGIAA